MGLPRSEPHMAFDQPMRIRKRSERSARPKGSKLRFGRVRSRLSMPGGAAPRHEPNGEDTGAWATSPGSRCGRWVIGTPMAAMLAWPLNVSAGWKKEVSEFLGVRQLVRCGG